MSQPLAKAGFRFLDDKELNVLNIADDNPKGYLLEASLRYPKQQHGTHNSFPVAPVRRVILNDEFLPYAKKLWQQMHPSKSDKMKGRGRQEKLVTDLHDKERYIVHYRNLTYIDFNTQRRKEAKSEFEKKIVNILNCSVFGKIMENQRRYKVVHLVINNERKLNKIVSIPTFETCKIFNKNLVAAQCRNVRVVITRKKEVSMIRKYHNHKPQTTSWYREKQLNHHETPGRQIKQATSSLFLIKMIALQEWT